MATQDDSVLGTEETNGGGFIDNISDKASDAFSYLGEQAGEAFEYVQESPIGEFFTEEDPIKLEESKIISKDFINEVQDLDKDTVIDNLSDLFNAGKTIINNAMNDDIQDQESFNAIQELRKNYSDELLPVLTKIEQLRLEPAYDVVELRRLENLRNSIEQKYNEQEISLVNKAIKGTTYEDRKAKLNEIESSAGEHKNVSNETKLIMKYSKESDEYINELSRKQFTDYKGFEESKHMGSITALKGELSEKYTSWKVNRVKSIQAMRDAGYSQDIIENRVKEYNEMETLYKEMMGHTLEAAYAGVTGDEMPKLIVDGMGEDKVNRMIYLENNLTASQQLEVGLGSLTSGSPISGIINTLAGATSIGIAKVKEAGEALVGTDEEKKLKKDIAEIGLFDKTGVNKWATWTLLNADDIILNVGGVIATGGLTQVGMKGTGAVLTKSSFTGRAVDNFSKVIKQNKTASFLINNKFIGVKNLSSNVVTGLIPNAIINTAANDVTSESRILFDAVMDLTMGPILDTIAGGVKTFTKTVEKFGGIPREQLVKAIETTYNLPTEQASELYDAIKKYREYTGIDLVTNQEKKDFTMSLLDNLKKSETGVIDKDGVIAKLEEDATLYSKLDTGLSENLSKKLETKSIDLNANTLETLQAERLFKQIDSTQTKTREGFVNKVLSNLGVSRKDIMRNEAETVDISNQMFDLAVKLKEDIQAIKDKGEVTVGDIPVLNQINRYQNLINDLSEKFNKTKQTVRLYTKDGKETVLDISDIETEGIRIKDTEGNQLFQTTSLFNKLKNLEYEGMDDVSAKFIKSRGGDDGTHLTDDQVKEVQYWIHRLTGIEPSLIAKSDIKGNEDLISLYQDSDGKYNIYVGGKFLKDLNFSENKIKIELSGEKYLKQKKKDKITTSKKEVKKEKPKSIFDVDYVTDKAEEQTYKAKDKTKNVQEVALNRKEIQEGEINKAIWNRILLSDKEFTGEEFTDIIASEAINIKKIISTKDDVLRNALTLKDIHEVKTYIKGRLKSSLDKVFNQRELTQFLELLDNSLFSDSGLNLLSRFSRGVKEKKKVEILGNLMESLALNSAYRFKSLNLSENIIKTLTDLGDSRAARNTISDILMGKNPIDVVKYFDIKGTTKQIVQKIQNATGIKVNNKLHNSTTEGIRDFLDILLKSKQFKGEIIKGTEDAFRKDALDKILNRVSVAQDIYMTGIMRQVYQGDSAADSLIRSLKEGELTKSKMTETQLLEANQFQKDILDAGNYEEALSVLEKRKGIVIPDTMVDSITKHLNNINTKDINKSDDILAEWIRVAKEIKETTNDLKDNILINDIQYSSFYEEGLYAGDNIVTKSLNHILNPKGRAEVFDEGISKNISKSIDTHVFKGENEKGFYEISKELRDETISEERRDILEIELNELQDKLTVFLNPNIKGVTGKYTKETLRAIGAGLKERNKALEKVYNETKDFLGKETKSYQMVNKEGKILTQKEIQEKTFSRKAKLGSYKSLLGTLQNRVKLRSFKGYMLDIDKKTIGAHRGLEEEKTLFNTLIDSDISKDGLDFTPIKVSGGSKLYNFVGGTREKQVHANNIYKYLRDNPTAKDFNDLFVDLKKIVKDDMKKLGFEDLKKENLEFIGTQMNLSNDTYMLSLNIGDKDGSGIGFNFTKEYSEGKTLNEIYDKVRDDFAVRFKDKYGFEGADRSAGVIGKRISVLTHEDTSMTPGINLKTIDFVTEELTTLETYLSKNRVDGFKVFSEDEEKIIQDILDKDDLTIEDKKVIVGLYENNEVIADNSIKDLYATTEEDTIIAKFNSITTADTDGASHQSTGISKLMSYYQGYVDIEAPVKYHYSEFGKDLNKTLWNPYSKQMEKSLKEQFFGGKNGQFKGYNIDASKIVGIESKKLGGKKIPNYKEFNGPAKYVTDETGVKRRIIGYRETETQYNRPASEEIYIEGKDVNGITKQVASNSHPVAKKLLGDYEIKKVEEFYEEIKQEIASGKDIAIPNRGDYKKFLNNIKNNLELENLSDTKRAYISGKIDRLLSNFDKPIEDGIGYRAPFIPRSTYINSEGKRLTTRTDEIYVSPNTYKRISEESGTISIEKNGKTEYYIMAYRSPVANSENATLQRVAIDKTMIDDGIALSPFNANVLKQADFDGDHLNITFVKEGVHAGGVMSALSNILYIRNDDVFSREVASKVYDTGISYDDKSKYSIAVIKQFLEETDEIRLPSVAVKQVEAEKTIIVDKDTNVKELALELFEKGLDEDTVKYGYKTYHIVPADKRTTKYKDAMNKVDNLAETKVLNQTGKKKKTKETFRNEILEYYKTKKEIKETIESNLQKQVDEWSEGRALMKANTDAIVGKDAISVVSASTRTYSGLRDISWEYRNADVTGVDRARLAELLSLKEDSEEFAELSGIFDVNDLTSKEYNSESATINQMTVDAAKTGKLPKKWEKNLLKAALGTDNISDKLDNYISTLGKDFSSTYKINNIEDYFTTYNKKEGKKVSDDYEWNSKKLFGRNVDLKNKIRDISQTFSKEIVSGKESMTEYLKHFYGVDKPAQWELELAVKKMLPEEEHWLADLVISGETGYKFAEPIITTKSTLKKVKGEWKGQGLGVPKQEWKKKSDGTFYPPSFNYGTTKQVIPLSEKELTELGIEFVHSTNVPYYQNTYKTWKGENGYTVYAVNKTKDLVRVDEGKGVMLKTSKDFKKRDIILEHLISKINDTKIIQNVGGTPKEYDKAGIIKLLHLAKGSKVKEEFLDWTYSQVMFPGEVLNKHSDLDKIAGSIIKQRTFLQDQIDSPKVTEELQKRFGGILESMGEIGTIKELKLSDNAAVITTDDLSKVIEGKFELEGMKYDITVVDNKLHITDETGENLLRDQIEVDVANTINEYKSNPLEADYDIKNNLGTTLKDLRDYEHKIDEHMDESFSIASLVNSKLAGKYFKEELLRTEHIAFGIPKGTYDAFIEIVKKYKSIKDSSKKKIDNLIYHDRHSKINTDLFAKITDTKELAYAQEVQKFYEEYLAKHVLAKDIKIKKSYTKGSIIEDLVGLEIGRTEKIPFLEKDIFTREKFEELSKTRMGEEYKAGGRRVSDLYGGIFERNILKEGWRNSLRPIRNSAYQIIYGGLSWFTSLGGLLVGTSQIPVEFLRIQSISNNIKGLTDSDKMSDLINKYGILHNVGIETAIRVGPQELNAPLIQKGLYTILKDLGIIANLKKDGWYNGMVQKIAAMGANPMLITDLVLDGARKQGAIGDTLYKMGFDSIDNFMTHIDSLPTADRDSLLSKVRLQSKMEYTDISGGVTAGSYLYRESYLSRRFVPMNFLMGWSNRIMSSALEDMGLAVKGFRKILSGDFEDGLDIIFNKSKAIEKFVGNTIMSIGLYSKIYSHDDYDGEYDKRKSITEWVMGMNANFIAIGMSFPVKILKAGYKGEEGIEVRMANIINQIMVDTFRELDLSEMLIDNIEDWMKGDRETITDAVLSAVNDRAMKGLLYNKVVSMQQMYSEFRERDDISSILGLGISAEDEKLFFDMYSKQSDLNLQALIDNNKHHIVLLEAIKSAPMLSLVLKNEDFGSYQTYVKEHKGLLDYLASDELNEAFLNLDHGLNIIEQEGNVGNLFAGLSTSTYSDGLDSKLKAKLKTSLARLNEDMIVDVLKDKYGAEYASIIAGQSDGGLEYIREAMTEDQMETNQLLMKLASESPSASPYILAQLLSSEMYAYKKIFKERRDIYGTESPMTNIETAAVQRELIKKYEPLLRASALTENQLAGFIAASAKPEFMNTILSNGYIKDTVSDRIAMQLAVSKSFQRGEANPTYLTSRLATITNKLERSLTEDNITEEQFKGKIIDLYNYGLDQINNSNVTLDQKVEIKSTMLKSLGEYGYVLHEDPLLNRAFDGARVNLMHKLFDHITDLKPYAEAAKISLADSTGRIPKGTGKAYSPYRSKASKGFGGGLGSSVPKLRNMLNQPKNGFKKSFVPGYNGYNPNTKIRPLKRSGNIGRVGFDEFRKYLIEQKSLGLIRPSKKYKAPPKYIKVARAETIKVALEQRLKPIYTKRTKGLLSDLPYNR